MSGPRRAGFGAAAVAACVVATGLGGCSAPPEPYTQAPTESYTVVPSPEDASTVPSTSLPPPVDCGDPTASLRPFPSGQVPSGPALDAIRARDRLVVGLATGSNLLSFRNPTTGAIEGFDVDLAREIARDLLGSPDKVEFRILTSAEREEALKNSEVDVVVKSMAITCERLADIDFSSVYYDAHQRILVMAGSPVQSIADLAGRRVCAAAGTTSLDRLRREQPAAEIVAVPLWSDCLVMLQQLQVDAVSGDDTLLAGMATQDPYARLVGPNIGTEQYGVGITKGNDDLVRFVNGTLERIRRDGTWERLYDKWLSILGPAPEPPSATYRD